LIATPRTYAAP